MFVVESIQIILTGALRIDKRTRRTVQSPTGKRRDRNKAEPGRSQQGIRTFDSGIR